jgi:hypothetical protein
MEADRWPGLDLRHLIALKAIAEEGSFGRAAEKLGYTQSAISQQIAALERVAGKNVVSRIKRVPDPAIISIVDGWPRNFSTDRAAKLGFTTAEKTFDDIIRIHIEDELGGKFAA